jgi:UDP-MurNAc hydroxylase
VKLISTGSTVEVTRDASDATVTHLGSEHDLLRPFTDKRTYLSEYAARTAPVREQLKVTWAHTQEPLLPQIKDWWEPLMQLMPTLCGRLGDRILLETEREQILVDFVEQQVEAYTDQEYRYQLQVEDRLVRSCVERRLADWVNELFLSCRFQASRRGPYNEHVYTWFKSLSGEHARYVEDWLSSDRESHEMWRFGDHLVQRHCPHLGADLARFGDVEDGVLTCQLHGWQFDIDTGKCLTSDDTSLRSKRIAHRDPEDILPAGG